MPVFRSGVHPREPMMQLHVKECISNAEMMVSAKLQQTLTIFVAFADAKMTKAVGPRALIVAHSGIEIAKKNQGFILRDVFDNFIILAVKGILSVGARSQGWSIGRKQVGGA